jgi:hypothetical protein
MAAKSRSTTGSPFRQRVGAGPETVDWLTIRIFVSSTFNDMLAERDLLACRVFPRLREWCEPRRIHVVHLDLRWGVTDEMAYRDHAVVTAALRGVERAHPFLISFVSQRYGWIPAAADAPGANPLLASLLEQRTSIVELELIQAVEGGLLSASEPDRPKAQPAIYFRQDDVLSTLPQNVRAVRRVFAEEHLANYRQREQRRLSMRARLAEAHATTSYTAVYDATLKSPELALPLAAGLDDPATVERWRNSWKEAIDAVIGGTVIEPGSDVYRRALAFNQEVTSGRLASLACLDTGTPLEDRIFADLKQRLLTIYPDREESVSTDPLNIDLRAQSAIRVQLTEAAVSNPEIESPLEAYIFGEHDKPAVLRGSVGTGKSTVLALMASRLEAESQGLVYSRFVGGGDRTSTLNRLLRSILEEHGTAEIPEIPDALYQLSERPSALRRTRASSSSSTVSTLWKGL